MREEAEAGDRISECTDISPMRLFRSPPGLGRGSQKAEAGEGGWTRPDREHDMALIRTRTPESSIGSIKDEDEDPTNDQGDRAGDQDRTQPWLTTTTPERPVEETESAKDEISPTLLFFPQWVP